MFGKTLPREEKLKAAGAFGAIAATSAFAFDVMLFGGYQIDPAPTQAAAQTPRDNGYVEMIDGGWRSAYTTIATSWSAEFERDPEITTEDLAGDARAAPEGYRDAVYNVPSEDELYEEIAALYAEQDARAATRAAERTITEPIPEDVVEAEYSNAKSAAASDNPEPVTAYESASPW